MSNPDPVYYFRLKGISVKIKLDVGDFSPPNTPSGFHPLSLVDTRFPPILGDYYS